MIQKVEKVATVMTEAQEALALEQGAQVPMSHLVALQVMLVVQEQVETVEALHPLHRQKLMEHSKLVTAELAEMVETLELLETVELAERELLVETLV
jgi:hypothetical protein